MSRDYTFRDAKLREPLLHMLNAGGAMLALTGLKLPDLSPDSIEAAARKAAGTDELGGNSFREPLEVYSRALEEEAELSTFGRVVLRTMLVGSLATRARLHAWVDDHPEVLDERIEQPWVVVGLPRTGTSLLSILMGLDPEVRPLLHWESNNLAPPPTLAGAAEDPRIAASAKNLARMTKLNPALRAMHPFGATIAEECVALFMMDLRTLGLETQAFTPSYGRWLQHCDMAPAYAVHKLALQTLQSSQPAQRWSLKSPNHLWCLDRLYASYPDARVIWTHRDPGPVVASVASLNTTLQRLFTTREDFRNAGPAWRDKLFHAVSSGMAFDEKREPGWCHHLLYPDLIADPIAAVENIYQHFGDEVRPLHRRRMQTWMRDRPQDAFGRHRYNPTDFSLTYPDIRTHFAEYVERYQIPQGSGS